MKMDFSQLSPEELEELIKAAAQERAKRSPAVPEKAPGTVDAYTDPAWLIAGHMQGAIFNFRHPGMGWISFAIPPHETVKMRDLLNRICEELGYTGPGKTRAH